MDPSIRVSKDGLVWLGDPAWGNRKFAAHQFKELWELGKAGKGRILTIVSENQQRRQQVNAAFFGEPTVNSSMLDPAPMLELAPPNLVHCMPL